MTDIFISYARPDYLIAGLLNDRLNAAGYNDKVWWDQRIVPGEPYTDEIFSALNQAKAVLVLWTPDAITSDWVQKEARLAIRQRKYVPLKYRCEQVPDEFKSLQFIDITNWNSHIEHDNFKKLLSGVREVLDSYEQRQRLEKYQVKVAGKYCNVRTKKVRPFAVIKDNFAPRLVIIPSGQFYMGSAAGSDGERDAEPPEHPQHLVNISRPFAIGRYPVTFAEWKLALARCDSIRHAPEIVCGDDNSPVTGVNWFDALAYTEWLSDVTGFHYRLPTEAEWEYTCRAGTKGPFGIPELSLNSARYDARGSYLDSKRPSKPLRSEDLHPTNVTACATNGFNVSGMHGNVWEWTQDHWHPTYLGEKPIDGSAWEEIGPGENRLHRVVRGGSYKSLPQHLRSAQRAHMHPRNRQPNLGFRVVREII